MTSKAVIKGIMSDFMSKPYNSIEDPLDLWYHQLQPNTLVKPFTVGYSVGFGKAVAAMTILTAVVDLRHRQNLSDVELDMFKDHLAALMWMKAMTDPGDDIEDQVSKSISKKFRVTDRPRPHVIQLMTAFQRAIQWRPPVRCILG